MQSRGSEWHQWDLHFHTQSSYDYKAKTATNADIIAEMKKNGISVFAITDHHVIDIERLNDLQSLGKSEGITVLPGIEFLSDARGKEPIHFIGIFPENCDINNVWGQLQYKTDLHKIKSEQLKHNEVYCDLIDTMRLVKSLGGITTIHAGDKSGSVENITHSLPHNSAQKTDIAQEVDIYELGKESDQDGYRKFVFPHINRTIPMIICSDNHHIGHYKRKQKMWIKGTPNFAGLKYALNEPESRFYIGDEPPVIARVRENRTKYIKSLNISMTGKHDAKNKWFEDIDIPLNSELVTIIGHKGNGKSAISDIIAMCADSEHSDDFLFLHKNKFKKRGLADRFSAKLTFESGKTSSDRLLTHEIATNQQRLVRYLPQSYFEKVCNEIGKVEAFRAEVEKVVFQYVPYHKRFGQPTFSELITFKKEAVNKLLHHLLEEVRSLNEKIINLEDWSSPSKAESFISQKAIVQEELRVHITTKPLEIADPSKKEETEEVREKKATLQKLIDSKARLEIQFNELNESISSRSQLTSRLVGFNAELISKFDDINNVLEKADDELKPLGIKISEFIDYKFDKESLDKEISVVENQLESDLKEIVLHDDYQKADISTLNIQSKIKRYEHDISILESQFTGEQKVYQDYLRNLANWQVRKDEIEGSSDKNGTLNYYIAALNFISEDLPEKLNGLREERLSKTREIFKIKSEIKEFYDDIKSEIDPVLNGSDVSGLNIVSAFYPDSDLAKNILRNIKQNRSGTFFGVDEGSRILDEDLIGATDWDDGESITSFLCKLIDYLECDHRENKKEAPIFIGDVTNNRKELYDLIFGLEYLSPHYDLRQKGKSLDQLSPGEKGALLLVFYLVLDKEDIPLIIDQPEDNLDNNSVATVLVPYIRDAKLNRQIIMVTHNPNLAVVSDSEQVIKVEIDKEDGNRFSFISGGIESQIINNHIVEVLEGTIPAFTLRRDKYQIN
ncbi:MULTISPECIES: TrlF family AAA-like ATPase [unclassified Vibrio]|uniref:TrlF family AAA-like ATPase n=2 Tax=Vibrio TaxID=662 RepID=UPI00354BA19C